MTQGIELSEEQIDKIRKELSTKTKRQLASEMDVDVWTVRKYAKKLEEE